MAQIVLADEINRATPKTQSALLEAMEEGQMTVDGVTYRLSNPFLIMATQNPIEYEGTFPLPEAQLDRFLDPHPDGLSAAGGRAEESSRRSSISIRFKTCSKWFRSRSCWLLNSKSRMYTSPMKCSSISSISSPHPVAMPMSILAAVPRGSLALFRTAQARAAMTGRDFVIPDDVKALAEVTLAHRIIVGPAARIKNITSRTIVQDILQNTARARFICSLGSHAWPPQRAIRF